MKKMIITICFLSLGLLVYAAVSDDTPSSSSKTEIIKNDKIVTVAPYWNHIINEKNNNIITPCYFNNSLRVFRVIKFLYKSDLSFGKFNADK